MLKDQQQTYTKSDFVIPIAYALEQKASIALYRLPGETRINLLVDFSEYPKSFKRPLEDYDKGFLIVPFDRGSEKHLLHPDLYLNNEDPVMDQVEDHSKLDMSLKEELVRRIEQNASADHLPFHETAFESSKENEDWFHNYVSEGVSMIKSGQLHKVVPSRTKDVQIDPKLNKLALFNALCSAYPNAFVSLISTSKFGTWVGASPEILVKSTQKHFFSTMALAGTKAYDEELGLNEVLWSQKEIEEQALVSRYIINCFKKIRLREFEEIGPRTVRAGNLVHLRTDYKVDMEATAFPELTSTMLELLHPTSAVCGMPREKARQFIETHEPFERKLFAGYFGPVNIENNTYCFVNLRCMSFHEGQIRLYAGAGLTADSKPERELRETELKFETLKNILDQLNALV
ncbi:MAG: chorismate-binding protein [Bacteroidota bacterium]